MQNLRSCLQCRANFVAITESLLAMANCSVERTTLLFRPGHVLLREQLFNLFTKKLYTKRLLT